MPKYKKLEDVSFQDIPEAEVIQNLGKTDNNETRVWLGLLLEQHAGDPGWQDALNAVNAFNQEYGRVMALLPGPFRSGSATPADFKSLEEKFAHSAEQLKKISMTPENKGTFQKIYCVLLGLYEKAVINDRKSAENSIEGFAHKNVLDGIQKATNDPENNRKKIWMKFKEAGDALKQKFQPVETKTIMQALGIGENHEVTVDEKEQDSRMSFKRVKDCFSDFKDECNDKVIPTFNDDIARLLNLSLDEQAEWKSLKDSFIEAKKEIERPKIDRSHRYGLMPFLPILFETFYSPAPVSFPLLNKAQFFEIFEHKFSKKMERTSSLLASLEKFERELFLFETSNLDRNRRAKDNAKLSLLKEFAIMDFSEPLVASKNLMEKIQKFQHSDPLKKSTGDFVSILDSATTELKKFITSIEGVEAKVASPAPGLNAASLRRKR